MKNQCIKIIFLLLLSLQINAQRNVVVIIADDLGKEFCDIYPDHATNTVHLTNVRRLLNKGILFNNAWANPLCSPTRAGMLTGRYSFRTGVGDVVDGSNTKLSLSENIIPKVLNIYNPNGISKALFGKWHLTSFAPVGYSYPNTMGFDHFEGSLTGALGQPGQQANGYYNWTKITNGVSSTCTNYATTENVNNAIAYLNNQPSTKPFFIWLAFNAPHTPYQLPPASLITNTGLTGVQADITANPTPYFQAMVEAMDNEIGRFFDYLISIGKWDNTDFIFIGDNGDDSYVAQSNPAKGSVYQGGITVPFIVSGPDVVNPNRTSDAMVNTADIFATVLEMFGDTNWQNQIPTTTVDSHSLMPIITNTATTTRPWAFSEVFRNTPLASDGKAIRNADYKLLKLANGTEKFFNLTLDASETNNLLVTSMTATDIANYNYLCNEMATLVGSGITCTALSTDSFLNTNEIFVIQNPFKNNIIINTISNEDTYELYSIKGEKIKEGKDLSNQDFSALASGAYLVKLITQNKVFKIIKE
ncbi:sulfatase-like hydrolase/transferase [Flavobacterium sp. N1994]|uniref:sulfatase-like hydrolase/transferase n=1 Tax=Flavobacterium sp. N1994 TaxID=2986827 RepID=UPI002222E508|nr:sulfatase-like hydrolase/transferase [Flavobacterium sp. N1994]